jgi:hypothetical protein
MAYYLNSQGIIEFHRGRPTLDSHKKGNEEEELNESRPALSMKDSSIDADDDLNKNGSEDYRELEREKSYEEEDESEKRNRTIF